MGKPSTTMVRDVHAVVSSERRSARSTMGSRMRASRSAAGTRTNKETSGSAKRVRRTAAAAITPIRASAALAGEGRLVIVSPGSGVGRDGDEPVAGQDLLPFGREHHL